MPTKSRSLLISKSDLTALMTHTRSTARRQGIEGFSFSVRTKTATHQFVITIDAVVARVDAIGPDVRPVDVLSDHHLL